MKFRKLPVLLAVGGMALAGCGSDDDKSGSSSGAKGNGTDRAFVAAMIPHHESAVQMAEVAVQRGESKFVKDLANDIIRTQNEEIATMRREDEALDIAGVKAGKLAVPDHMTGMGGDAKELQTADPFDKAFIDMMIPHHEGAVTMAKEEIAKGGDPELKSLAQDIVTAQEREIKEMKGHLGGKTDAEHSDDSGH